ncbi:hypothetical protein PGT21_026475 [Puccinia graminis f. sp. tritici]|uniref:Uncharacterized protein n=1 Tax=Puccinia graminis f. sp. tritici TaxID=56615 RepID=A0A5B0MMI7_PUCGR|nr:hypothetical protein PGT21_026475 [Puccinia graminis f. sp. tritici]
MLTYCDPKTSHQRQVTLETGADNWGSGRLLISLATSLIRTDYYTSDHSSHLAKAHQSGPAPSTTAPQINHSMSTPANKSVYTTTAAEQASATKPIGAAHPLKASKKPVARVPKKAKKPISPEIVPSEWDTSSEEDTKSDKPKPKSSAAPELKKSSTTSDPFKSKKPIDKLIDKDILKNITIKKSTPAEKTSSLASAPSVPTDQTHASFTTEPYEPADSSDLDVIAGATAQLWSKPKTSKAPLAEDILQRYHPLFHPLLQAVKLQQEYYRRALETNDEDPPLGKLLPPLHLRYPNYFWFWLF